jgi:hypothetical protein
MHTEKNVAANIVQTIMGHKDTDAVRVDLQDRNMQKHLWLQKNPRKKSDGSAGDPIRPHADYCLGSTENRKFLAVLRKLKVPTGFSSSLGKCITTNKKLAGLKSHDYHQLMQQILPLALTGLMSQGPYLAIGQLSSVWRRICGKVWDPTSYKKLKEDVAYTLCLLEIHFPPSFFDVMTHLMVHIVEEVDLCGPVFCRWMYPVERALKVCKWLVRNMARPEASMAEGFVILEALGYLYHMDTVVKAGVEKGIKPRVIEGEYESVHLEGAGNDITLGHADLMAMHHYILENEDVVKPWYK